MYLFHYVYVLLHLRTYLAIYTSLKSGKVVVVLQGKYAGKKAVVVKTLDGGHGSRKFPHAISKLYLFNLLCFSNIAIQP
jgi:hypothetical protein